MLTTRVDGAYLDRAGPQLRVVANYAVGVNNVDLAARGREASSSPTHRTCSRGATAELAVGLMLALLRRIAEGDRFVRRRERMAVLARVHARLEPRRESGSSSWDPAESDARRRRWPRHSAPARRSQAEPTTSTRSSPSRTSSASTCRSRRRRGTSSTGLRFARCRVPPFSSTPRAGRSWTSRRSSTLSGRGELAGAALDVYEREPEVEEGLLGSGERRAHPASRQRDAGHAGRDGDALRGRPPGGAPRRAQTGERGRVASDAVNGFGSASMWGDLRRVLVRRPLPEDASAWEAYGWRGAPEPGRGAGRARGLLRAPRGGGRGGRPLRARPGEPRRDLHVRPDARRSGWSRPPAAGEGGPAR